MTATIEKPKLNYPSNKVVNGFVENIFDRFLTDTMPETVKESTQRMAAYLDFSLGYWFDYEKHVMESMPRITREVMQRLSGGKFDSWPAEIQRKVMKRAEAETTIRLEQMRLMRMLLEQQQKIMKFYSPEQTERFEQIQENIEQ